MLPDRMTPAWSQALALVCQSPYWQSLRGMERRWAFVERAAQYPTYDEMPRSLKTVYQQAYRRLAQ